MSFGRFAYLRLTLGSGGVGGRKVIPAMTHQTKT
jgi:hypothetical protein